MGTAIGVARADSIHTCPVIPHVGGPVTPPCSPNVRVNGVPVARASDRAACAGGPPDFIVTGASAVRANGLPLARIGSLTMHGGSVVDGSVTVNVRAGGGSAGVRLGAAKETSIRACQAMRAGRHPPPGAVYPPGDPRAGRQIPSNTPGQSYNNCSIESSRLILFRATGVYLTQEQMLKLAFQRGDAQIEQRLVPGKPFPRLEPDERPQNLYESGGANFRQNQDLLGVYGVSTSWHLETVGNVAQAVAEKRGVITAHRAADLWASPRQAGYHAVVVSAVTFDDKGQVASFTTIDSGLGDCAREVPVQRFDDSIRFLTMMTATDEAIW
jgi:uncharacterized Zn-binding protein involved in type VI secretion